MKSRRKAREAALQALYALDMGGELSQVSESAGDGLEPSLAAYAKRLAEGVVDVRAALDQNIAGYLKGYDLDRLASVDRNILRIATYELLHIPEVPPAVSIDEAVELAKLYSTAESGKFVNGVLARVLTNSPKANWDPATAPSEEPAPPAEEPVEQEVSEDSDEASDANRLGKWIVR
jgi:N utilization substance protein B